ncbi:MAG: hypothetical protein NEHIOOID_00630 [Holosporales bacterium]
MKKIWIMLFLFIGSVFASPSSALLSKGTQEKDAQMEQVFYLEKLVSLLDALDDEKKRDIYIKDFFKIFNHNIFSIETLKIISFYILKLCIVIAGYMLIKRLGMRLLNYQMEVLASRRKQRRNLTSQENLLLLETLASLFKSIFIWVLRSIFTILFLIVMGFSVGPLLYGVSFFGMALSFASKNIIQDFINGILIILDGSMAVGEYVNVASHRGRIESITLRSLSLRNSSGELIVIPFSNINEVTNFSRTYSRIRADFIIQKYQPLEPVYEAYRLAFEEFKQKFAKEIKDDLDFLGVTNVDSFGSTVSAVFTSTPDPTRKMFYKFNSLAHKYMNELQIKRVDGHGHS